MVETAGRQFAVEGDVGLGKAGPTGKRVTQGADTAAVSRCRPPTLGLFLFGHEAGLIVERQFIDLIDVGTEFIDGFEFWLE